VTAGSDARFNDCLFKAYGVAPYVGSNDVSCTVCTFLIDGFAWGAQDSFHGATRFVTVNDGSVDFTLATPDPKFFGPVYVNGVLTAMPNPHV
jgi:hypothetical protein